MLFGIVFTARSTHLKSFFATVTTGNHLHRY